MAFLALAVVLLGLNGAHDRWALLLEKLAERVVVFERDSVALHDVVVQKLRGGLNGEASAVGHSESLRHLLYAQNLIGRLSVVCIQDLNPLALRRSTIGSHLYPR